jgi:amino acid permease
MESFVSHVFKSIFGRWAGKPQDQNFYVKIVFAMMSGVLCALGGEAFRGIRGLTFGLLVYVLTLYVVVYLLEVDPATLGGRQKLITGALPSYLLLWVLIWTLLSAFTAPGL